MVADLWRLYEMSPRAPIDCELYAPPKVLKAPELLAKILRVTARLAAKDGASEIPLPCPSNMIVEDKLVTKREFAFAWFRKRL